MPGFPASRMHDIGEIGAIEDDSRVGSPRPSQQGRPRAEHIALLEHEPVPIVRVAPSLRCDEP